MEVTEQMKAAVRKFDSAGEYFFAEGCFITELSNTPDDPGLSIARARLEPGRTTQLHHLLATAERYVIVAGSGLVDIADLPPESVAAGDVVLIPPGCPQRISNTGADDLVFLAICSPAFRPEVYVDLES